jgi:WD40 repeat protein
MPGDAGRTLGERALRRPLYLCDDVSSSQVKCVAVFPDGRHVVSGSVDGTLKVWDVKNGEWECVVTLKGHSSTVRCGVHCTFVMMCLRRRSMALGFGRTASFLHRATGRSSCSRARFKGT